MNSIVVRSQLKSGMHVEINPQRDRSRKLLVNGVIEDIITNSETHSHGILVKLVNGETGRVKRILNAEATQVVEPVEQSSGEIVDEMDASFVRRLIDGGENFNVEFKTSAFWSVRLSPKQLGENSSSEAKMYGRNASKVIIAKSIAALLNSDGGYLLIGVKENKKTSVNEIVGIESEFGKLQTASIDGYRLMVLDSIIKSYFPSSVLHHLNSYIRMHFIELDGRTICVFQVIKSSEKIFLKIKNNDMFFIRVDASTRQLSGQGLVDYCFRRFS